MKTRRHHNNSGQHQVATGRTQRQVEAMAERLGLRLRVGAIIRDYAVGRVESRQPGGVCYVLESSDAPEVVFAATAQRGEGAGS